MNKIDADSLIDWLNESEDEAKATLREKMNGDPFIEGTLSAICEIRKYVEKMTEIEKAEEKNGKSKT